MLHLSSDSSQAWLAAALQDVDTVLLDHAHCEKKAASTAMSLMFRYQDQPALLRTLSAIAREELEHFDLCLDWLDKRGVPYDRMVPSPYAKALMTKVRKDEPFRLLDTLLCCALIEARSCERMKLLSEHLPDAELAAFYKGLLASEARHFHVYIDLAQTLTDGLDVKARLAELSAHEAEILRKPMTAVRMHA